MINTINLPPFKKICVTIGNLPSSFMESMTYYETLCWLYNYFEKTLVPAVNTNSEAITELQNYVVHYFDNLDVQEEIDHKLDEMALDGTLEGLLKTIKVYNVAKWNILPNNETAYTFNFDDILAELPNGAILYFPNGTYNFNVNNTLINITKPLTILGDNEAASVIKNTGSGDIINIKLETEEKRYVTISNITLDEVNAYGKNIEILSEAGYYLADFRMENVKCNKGSYGFYLNGVTSDNLFLTSITNCTFWDSKFYANNIGDTVKITGCQFAFDGGIYINQVSGASTFEFNNNNVTATDGFILETNSSPLIINNIFEMSRLTNNENGYVEICPTNENRMFEVMIMSNTFSYASNFTNANKPLLYIGKTGKCKLLANYIGVQDENYSLHISSNAHTTELNSTFGVYYGSETFAYALNDEGTNTIIRGTFYNGVFYDGVKTSTAYEKYTTKKTISGTLDLINGNPTFSSSTGTIAIKHGTYVDDYSITSPKEVAYITHDGLLPLDLLIGGINTHCRIKFMAYALPTEDLQAGDLFINKYITTSFPYPLYYYDGTSVRGIGELH